MKLPTRGGAHGRLTMISSKDVLVTGGQFSQYNYHGQASLDNKVLTDGLHQVHFTTLEHGSIHRNAIRGRARRSWEKIMGWILGAAKQEPVKSAIAQSTIEQGIERGLLLASFFFSRSDSSRNHTAPLIATLAYKLSTDDKSILNKGPTHFKKTLQRQFTSLVIQPLEAYLSGDEPTQHRMPFVIVIDGLDECIDRASQKAILTGLASSVQTLDPQPGEEVIEELVNDSSGQFIYAATVVESLR
ncbi:hypothetical protein CPC08DRAFT_752219 [Agrocybe pediades]|nr:hypothetical protein CPC08DRAFT_752219 [Agrocybe pediades]